MPNLPRLSAVYLLTLSACSSLPSQSPTAPIRVPPQACQQPAPPLSPPADPAQDSITRYMFQVVAQYGDLARTHLTCVEWIQRFNQPAAPSKHWWNK